MRLCNCSFGKDMCVPIETYAVNRTNTVYANSNGVNYNHRVIPSACPLPVSEKCS